MSKNPVSFAVRILNISFLKIYLDFYEKLKLKS